MNPSYAYVYDEFLSDRRYERELAALDTALHTFDLAGRVARLSLFRHAKDMIVDMVRQGVSTVVLVGNDATLERMMGFLPELNVTLGYIPMDKTSLLGELLGIPRAGEACDTLSARLVETIDVGCVNGRYYLTEARVESVPASLKVDGRYGVSFEHGGVFSIRNLGGIEGKGLAASNVQDGLLEAHLTPYGDRSFMLWRRKEETPTRIFVTGATLEAEREIELRVDNEALCGKRFHFSILPKQMRIITGRQRRTTSTLRKTGKIGNVRAASDRRGR